MFAQVPVECNPDLAGLALFPAETVECKSSSRYSITQVGVLAFVRYYHSGRNCRDRLVISMDIESFRIFTGILYGDEYCQISDSADC